MYAVETNTILVYETGLVSSCAVETNTILVYETGLASSYAVETNTILVYETGLAGSWALQSKLKLTKFFTLNKPFSFYNKRLDNGRQSNSLTRRADSK